jgi:hypothetical protein
VTPESLRIGVTQALVVLERIPETLKDHLADLDVDVPNKHINVWTFTQRDDLEGRKTYGHFIKAGFDKPKVVKPYKTSTDLRAEFDAKYEGWKFVIMTYKPKTCRLVEKVEIVEIPAQPAMPATEAKPARTERKVTKVLVCEGEDVVEG